MNGKIIQVRNGEALYKCDSGHIWGKQIQNPFDPAEPAPSDPCYTCTQASITYRTAGIGD